MLQAVQTGLSELLIGLQVVDRRGLLRRDLAFSATSFSMRLALSRIAWATPSHFFSWSGVILSAAFSVVMRCSTVSGLLLVAAAGCRRLASAPSVGHRRGEGTGHSGCTGQRRNRNRAGHFEEQGMGHACFLFQ